MTDIEQILRDHATAADRTEPSPDGWDRLVARLEDEPPIIVPVDGRAGRRGRAARVPVLAAAAVVVVVLVAAGVALARSGDDGPAPVATDPSAPPATSGLRPTPGFRNDTDVDQASRPNRIIAVVDHDRDSYPDVVRIEDLVPFDDDPADVTVLVAGASVAPNRIRSVDVSAEGTALYGVCCDLMEGEVHEVDIADGTDLGLVAVGTSPAVSGDGRLLATVTKDQRTSLLDRETDQVTWFDGPTGAHDEITGLSLSPDGAMLARERITRGADGTVVVTAVDVTATDDPDGWEPIERSSGAGLPAFMPDGHLALGLGTYETSAGHDEVHASEVGMADLSTGAVRWSVGGGGFSFTFFDATPDGQWVIVGREGLLRAFAAVDGWLYDNGSVGGVDGMVDAAW
ncbi:MAG TPA: hypothetical protein VK507_25690 [Iamia sp.]|nr:hypothetical protein [Iamia sp.]